MIRKVFDNQSQVLIFEKKEGAEAQMVKLWRQFAQEAIIERGVFTAALSGGTTPVSFYERLSRRGNIPWDQTRLFVADERMVPENDPDSNSRMIREKLVVPAGVKSFHPIRIQGRDAHACAAEYEKNLRNFLPAVEDGFAALDCVLLGIGEDGCVASLYPESEALSRTYKWVVATSSGNHLYERVSMSLPLLAHAREVVFLVTGPHKAPIVKKAVSENPPHLPVARLFRRPAGVRILADELAAAMLL